VDGILETIVDRVEKAGLQSPAIIVMGNVVSLRDRLNWFEKKSLWGKRIVVTRAREQASNMTAALSDLGADVLEFPTIRVVPPKDWSSLDQALENIKTNQWLIFTSVNGVKFFFGRLFENHLDVRCLSHIKTACIGPETARALRGFGIKSDIIPKSYVAEAVVEAFQNEAVENQGILIPGAETARPILPVELRKMGARVDEIPVYRTEPVSENRDTLIGHLEDKTIHLVTFTSSSTATNFKSLLPGDRMGELMKGVAVACIGPITAETAQSIGFKVDIVAENFTIPGLCEAVVKHLTSG
ncbi:MAG: HemD protein, partial [Desulfobacteraceae bacterium]|nr:HemD protein [Desulfobacteraceae bacterium]